MHRSNTETDYLKEFSNYLIRKGVCSVTSRGYIFDTRQFIEWLAENGLNVNKVAKQEAQLYVAFLVSRQYLSSTIQKKLSSLRTFFEFLEEINV